jgi:hypothetical protein
MFTYAVTCSDICLNYFPVHICLLLSKDVVSVHFFKANCPPVLLADRLLPRLYGSGCIQLYRDTCDGYTGIRVSSSAAPLLGSMEKK